MPALGRTRQAQLWASVLAETIESTLWEQKEKGKDLSQILPYEPDLPPFPRGQGIRVCQEVNLAKKQLDAREQAKKDQSIRHLEEVAAKGGEAGLPYMPRTISWNLKGRDIGDDQVKLYASKPLGRNRAGTEMMALAMAFADKIDMQKLAQAPEKPDIFKEYLDAAIAPAPQKTQADKQEDLLASLYGLEKGEGK